MMFADFVNDLQVMGCIGAKIATYCPGYTYS